MAHNLLDLPLEVHRAIFNHLNYPDLKRLRDACRQLRQIHIPDILQRALLQLENDWIAASHEANTYNTEHGMRNNDNWMNTRTSTETRMSPLEMMLSRGYLETEICMQHARVPCYGCLRLCPIAEHLDCQDLSQLAEKAAALARSYQQLPSVVPTRKCVRCILESTEYLEESGGRWLCVDSGWGISWIAICRSCNERTTANNTPPGRQRSTDTCEQCYKNMHATWFQAKESVQSGVEIVGQQMAEMKQKFDALSRCADWMRSVDEGRSVNEERPEELKSFDLPKMEDIRPDAAHELRSIGEELSGAPMADTPIWTVSIYFKVQRAVSGLLTRS